MKCEEGLRAFNLTAWCVSVCHTSHRLFAGGKVRMSSGPKDFLTGVAVFRFAFFISPVVLYRECNCGRLDIIIGSPRLWMLSDSFYGSGLACRFD